MKKNSLEIADKKANLIKRNLELVKLAKSEVRELSEDEEKEFDENEEEIKELDEELKQLEDELENETEPENDNPENAEEAEQEEQKKKRNKSKRSMKFNLMKELRNAMTTGKSVMIENRAYAVGTDKDTVATDLYDIIEPLRAKNVLVQAGARFMTNLVGDVQIPIMGAAQVGWAGETAAATDGSGTLDHVSLAPKRLTAKFPISLQFLAQDSVDAEGAIRNDIINAINDKLEATILGSAAGTATMPKGMFNGADKQEIASFADVTALEATLEDANVYGECKYIVSPSMKAALRGMIKGTNGTGMVMENNAIDGVDALSTSHVGAGDLVYGDFSNLVIGQWGDIQLDVVRDTASLANGCVTIVVNCFFDAKVARDEAFAFGTLPD